MWSGSEGRGREGSEVGVTERGGGCVVGLQYKSSSVDCAKGGLDEVRETITAQVMTDPQVCHCYTPQLHMYPYV